MTKYNYQPKTKEELKNLIKKLIKERGNEATLQRDSRLCRRKKKRFRL